MSGLLNLPDNGGPSVPAESPRVELLRFPLPPSRIQAWLDLERQAATDPLFNSVRWLLLWEKHFARLYCRDAFVLFVLDEQGLIAGVFPFTVRRFRIRGLLAATRIQVLGNLWQGPRTMRSEYADFPVREGFENPCARAVRDYLMRFFRWDDLVLQDVAEESRSVRALLDQFRGHADVREVGSGVHDLAQVIDVDGDYQTYVASLGQGTRRRLFNLRSRLEEHGDVRVTQTAADDVEQSFSELNRLHATRWGDTVFEGARLAFHSELSTELAADGLLSMSRLAVDGRTLSVLYNVIAQDREYNLQAGFDSDAQIKGVSLGYLHLGYSIERAFNDPRVRHYDLLAGVGMNEDFKSRFATSTRTLRSYQVVRSRSLRLGLKARDAARSLRSRF